MTSRLYSLALTAEPPPDATARLFSLALTTQPAASGTPATRLHSLTLTTSKQQVIDGYPAFHIEIDGTVYPARLAQVFGGAFHFIDQVPEP